MLHRAAYDVLGLAWSYDAVDVTADGLPALLAGLGPEWRGLSLTMPLKRVVMPLLDEVGAAARVAGGANTVLLDAGRLVGHNTDVPGIGAALRERHDGPVERAVVLGGGATAASAVVGLADIGCRHVTLLVREPGRAAPTVEAARRHPDGPTVDVRPLTGPAGAADVLLSTVPAAAQTEQVLRATDHVPVVFEVVYDPWPTPLARRAEHTGRVLVSGLDLLVHQAVLQVELMTGRGPAPLAAMREAGRRALSAR